MTQNELEKKLLSLKEAARDYPFGPDVAVFKVAGKIFALLAVKEDPLRISLKCNPAEADFFRTMYRAVTPGYHLNKNHWNTITINGSVPEELLRRMIDASYDLVVKGLPKAVRERLRGVKDV